MAFDDKLARRVRRILERRPGTAERKMFGGLAFLIDGRMCCGILGRDLVLRLGRDEVRDALRRPHVRPMDFTGRVLTTMVYVGPGGTAAPRDLRSWVELAVGCVERLAEV